MMLKHVALWIFISTGIAANLLFQDSLSADAQEARELKRSHGPSPALHE